MRQLILLLMTAVTLLAQQKGAKTKPTTGVPASEIRAEDQAEDPPSFKRKYFAKLTSKLGITMTLECENNAIFGDRECVATLRQPDEKSVSFSVGGLYGAYDSIADKIIDPVIVPEVKRLASEMHLQDQKYMASNPQEFKTSDGNRWGKVVSK